MFRSADGVGAECIPPSHKELDYPLTPIEPPKAFVLGEQMLASISEELRSRVRGWERSDGNVLVLLRDGKTVHDLSLVSGREDYHIILSPPPPPPKTDREFIEEIETDLTRSFGSHGGFASVVAIQAKIKQHIAEK